MKTKFLLVFIVILRIISPLYPQNNYRLIILDFKLVDTTKSFEYLKRNLPEALEPEISRFNSVITLEREQVSELLEEVEYQYDYKEIFNSSTIVKLNQIGASIALIGKINVREHQIRVDIKIVEIATGKRIVEDFIIEPENKFYKHSQIANIMEKLANNIRCTFEPCSLPKWPLYLIDGIAISSLLAGSYSYWQGSQNHKEYNDAMTKEDLNKYKENTEKFEKIFVASVLTFSGSVASYFIYKYKYNESVKKTNLQFNITMLDYYTPGLSIRFNF